MPKPLRFFRAVTLVALASLIGPAASLAQESEKFDQIAAETSEARELPITEDIVEAFLSRDELEQRLLSDLATEYPADEAAADERALKAFGLLAGDVSLTDLVLELYTEQIAGFYDPETNEMYLIGDDAEVDAEEEFTYAHEVIHALQDQAFDLMKVQEPVLDGTNDDRAIAITSLIEGDAVVGSVEYVLRHPVLAGRLALAGVTDTPVFDAAPPILTQSLLFPYLAGQGFVATIRGEDGWNAVDAVYRDPPASTEQILHPEKYIDRDDPTAVTLPDLATALGAGWTKAEENNFGEFQTSVLLANLAPGEGFDATSGFDLPEEATAGAAGWDGDRYAVWANGDQDVVIWSSVWDSEDDAAEFSSALQNRDEARFDGLFEGEASDQVTLIVDGYAVRITVSGTEVTYVLAPTLELADAAMGTVSDTDGTSKVGAYVGHARLPF